jgi:hypothetical protein
MKRVDTMSTFDILIHIYEKRDKFAAEELNEQIALGKTMNEIDEDYSI